MKLYKLMNKIGEWFGRYIAPIGAAAFIMAMAFADFLTMVNLFTELGLSDMLYLSADIVLPISEIVIYSVTMCLFLEGNPTFLGFAFSSFMDKTIYKSNDKAVSKWGAIISFIGFSLSYALTAHLRWLMIKNYGGPEAFTAGTYAGGGDANLTFIAHVFLLCSPFLTSLLAFVASWMFFRSNYAKSLEIRVDKLHKKYLVAQSEFHSSLHQLDDARMALWSSISVNERMPGGQNTLGPPKKENYPANSATFRKECYDRIRNKLIENSIAVFPGEVNRYQAMVTARLEQYIHEMESYSNVKPEFQDLSLQDIINKYDNEQPYANLKWDYDKAKDGLEKELREVLDNAIVVARYKTSIKPYHLEGD